MSERSVRIVGNVKVKMECLLPISVTCNTSRIATCIDPPIAPVIVHVVDHFIYVPSHASGMLRLAVSKIRSAVEPSFCEPDALVFCLCHDLNSPHISFSA